MAIFASRRVNVDPEPWVDESGDRWSATNGTDNFDPRPEFDNVVNPVLVEFRRSAPWDIPEAAAIELTWLSDPAKPIVEATPEHIDHARRVLQKLAAFRAGSE